MVEGNVPSAYLVPDEARDPVSAQGVYCELMEAWATAVIEGRTLEDVFPVEAESTPSLANSVLKRLDFVRTRLLPDWRLQWGGG